MYIQISQPQMSSVFAEKKKLDIESKKLQKKPFKLNNIVPF